MTTTVSFDIASDNEELRALVSEIKGDDVTTWRVAVFCAQQQLERAIRARSLRDYHERLRVRRAATRAARPVAVSRPAQEDGEQ